MSVAATLILKLAVLPKQVLAASCALTAPFPISIQAGKAIILSHTSLAGLTRLLH